MSTCSKIATYECGPTQNWKLEVIMHACFFGFFSDQIQLLHPTTCGWGLKNSHSCSFVSLLKPWALASIEAIEEIFHMQAPMSSSAQHMHLSFLVLLLPFPVGWLRPYINPVSHRYSRGRNVSAPFIMPSFLSVLIWSFPSFNHFLPHINFLIFHLKQIMQRWFTLFLRIVCLFPHIIERL